MGMFQRAREAASRAVETRVIKSIGPRPDLCVGEGCGRKPRYFIEDVIPVCGAKKCLKYTAAHLPGPSVNEPSPNQENEQHA
jgi:hypothetical protein